MFRKDFAAVVVSAAVCVCVGPAMASEETTAPLYMLTYDHGGLVLWGHDHFLEHLRNTAEWLDRYPSFKIGLDNEAHMYDYIAEHHSELLEEIRKYLKRYRGRFGIGTCTYGQPLSTFIGGESNIRQIAYALEADRRYFGCAPPVYLMSEHAMHSQMPQILDGFGFTGAIMRTHYMMYGYNPTFDAAIGWWVGLDGSRIPTIPTYKGEGAQFGRTTVDNWTLTRYPSEQAPKSLADFRRTFSHIRPLLASRADDSSLRREDLVREYEGKPGYRWILLEELFPAFPKPEKEFPTKPNDFTVRMPWGYCGNEIWNMSRRAEASVLTAERLAAAEMLLGGDNREATLDEAWKNLLVAQHHDIQICGILKDARRFLPASIAASERAADASLQYVASQMEGGGVAQVTVFNPLSWQRNDWIEVALSLPRSAARAIQVRHGERTIPSALLSADLHSDTSIREGRLALFADPPPLGFASYSIVPADEVKPRQTTGIEIDAEHLRIKTPYVETDFNADGGIASLVEVRTETALLRTDASSCFFEGTIDGKRCESKGRWAIEPARMGAPWVVARESGLIGGIPYTLEMKFRADTPRIDCRATFRFDGQRIGLLSDNKRDSHSPFVHEEKLRFRLFPAVGREAIGVRDLPFAVAETENRYVDGNYWTALTDNRVGIAVFNHGTMGSVREKDGGFSVPLAYAMYYIWGTRMLNGEFTYEFAIHPFVGNWRQADLHRRALEYNFPVAGALSDSGNGRFGSRVSLLDVPSTSVIVSAFYPKDGRALVRLFEHSGREAKVKPRYVPGSARLEQVNLAGNPIEEAVETLAFRPWEFKTLRIEPRP